MIDAGTCHKCNGEGIFLGPCSKCGGNPDEMGGTGCSTCDGTGSEEFECECRDIEDL